MPRRHVEHLHAPQLAARALDWPGWPAGAAYKPLSRDGVTGACSCVVVAPDGWRRPPATTLADCEFVVWRGTLRSGDEELRPGSYGFAPAGAADDEWEAHGDIELFFAARSGPPDLRPRRDGDPAASRTAVEHLPWGPTPIPDGPPNIEVALLRRTETGEMSALVRGGPRRFPANEFHDCVEECFLLDGDIMISPGGQMLAGTYFWRPPYLAHGQSSCERHSLLYVYTDGELVNRFADSLDRTPAENRVQALRERAAVPAT
jgi:hypothetical protein